MPAGLRRFQHSGQSHFLTFSCYHRRPYFSSPKIYDLFVQCLENMRRKFSMCVYGYVVMPEHVHLLVNEPPQGMLADAIHYLKLSFTKRLHGGGWAAPTPRLAPKNGANLGHQISRSFWGKRYYDRNVREAREFTIKLRYLHRNPVKRGLVDEPGDWEWSSFRHYALREVGVVEIESEWTARDRELRVSERVPRVFLSPG